MVRQQMTLEEMFPDGRCPEIPEQRRGMYGPSFCYDGYKLHELGELGWIDHRRKCPTCRKRADWIAAGMPVELETA